ncbi:hypothetical protein H5410_019483 [Solanum commersonii]|uniref:Disease resistance N-terminal domain-containing protein n=1 Tax=Solanum commersonii TaxID=4109 RepID=A0A9J5Z6E2_SOLCO|nr:hypothetical protein H5410_019483 [Solanum commersonii]
MADTVVNFLVENLLQLLSENVALIKGADDEFNNLLEEVQRLKAFLDDASKYHSDCKQWDQLVKDIQKKEKGKVGRFFDKVSHIGIVKDLATEIKGIHDKVKKLRD